MTTLKQKLLSTEDISVRFGGLTALDDVSVWVDEGQIRGLIGPNGAGKTTLINVISGMLPPTSGVIQLRGEQGPWSIRKTVQKGLCRTFQEPRAFWELTVRRNLEIAALPHAEKQDGREVHSTVDHVASSLGLTSWLGSTAIDLPYGVLRRLGIGLAMATHPDVLLLDEPAVGLTGAEIAELGESIRALRAEGVTILLVEHNMRFLMQIADRVTVLDQGSVIFEGTPEECQRNERVIESYLGRRSESADDI